MAGTTIAAGDTVGLWYPSANRDERQFPEPYRLDVGRYLGTWYEQGSVRQFFSIGLVNTKAVYSLNPDDTIKVQNSGNYFGPNGPASNITGSAVPVNEANTRLSVGFFFGQPSSDEPGNYWILDYAPDYSWAIMGLPDKSNWWIWHRSASPSASERSRLVARAGQLGFNTSRTVHTGR